MPLHYDRDHSKFYTSVNKYDSKLSSNFFMHILFNMNSYSYCDIIVNLLQLKVSYLEIHLDEVRDLLSNTAEEIHIREDDRGNTVVQGNPFQRLNLNF